MLTWRFGAYLHDGDDVIYHETAVRSVKIYLYCTRIRRASDKVSTKVNAAWMWYLILGRVAMNSVSEHLRMWLRSGVGRRISTISPFNESSEEVDCNHEKKAADTLLSDLAAWEKPRGRQVCTGDHHFSTQASACDHFSHYIRPRAGTAIREQTGRRRGFPMPGPKR
jgi:hypothetical protein